MKPDVILRSNFLDILFENRNKDYGAYDIRKNYNKRLIQALGATTMLVVLFTVLQGLGGHKSDPGELVYEGTMVNLPSEKQPEQPKEKPKEKPQQPQKQRTLTNFIPVIKPNVVETTVNNNEDLNHAIVGDKPVAGDPVENGVVVHSGGEAGGNGNETDVTPPPEEAGVLEVAEVMPVFNGDIAKYMLRNLRQPDDLEAGQRIVVRVRFVVTADGAIDDVQVAQSGRSDLDEEVMRVVRKMPHWKPGRQGGRNVPVYFYLPVTFIGNAD